jgi:hypothetical protein
MLPIQLRLSIYDETFVPLCCCQCLEAMDGRHPGSEFIMGLSAVCFDEYGEPGESM